MGHSEEIKLFQVYTGDCNVYFALHNFIRVCCNQHTFLMIHSVFERNIYFMVKELMESTFDVIWQFGVPFQFDIFTIAVGCV